MKILALLYGAPWPTPAHYDIKVMMEEINNDEEYIDEENEENLLSLI